MNKAVITLLYKSFCGHTFSFLVGNYLKVELLGHRVDGGLGFMRNRQTVLQSGCTMFHPDQKKNEFQLLHILICIKCCQTF